MVGFLLSMYISWLISRDFRAPGAWALAVAGGFGRRGCGWELLAPGAGCGCGWGALVQMRCLWLGLECGFVYSLGSCRACLHNALCQCLHDMHRCTCALLCLHGCLHALLHCRHMMTHRIDYALMACSIVSTDCIIECAALL